MLPAFHRPASLPLLYSTTPLHSPPAKQSCCVEPKVSCKHALCIFCYENLSEITKNAKQNSKICKNAALVGVPVGWWAVEKPSRRKTAVVCVCCCCCSCCCLLMMLICGSCRFFRSCSLMKNCCQFIKW